MIKINNTSFNTNTETVISELRSELARKGSKLLQKEPKLLNGYLMVCCPYHKDGLEKKPSAQFRVEDGLFYCFACQQVHSLPEVIEHCLHINGWKWLRDRFEFESVESRDMQIDFGKKEIEKPKYVDPKELEKYRFIHPYMYERKLDLQTIRKFDIGYDQETNCLTFPVKDKKGNILFIARRSVSTKWFNYPESSKKPLYGLYEILREIDHGKQINEIYVTESMINCLTLWSWGYYACALNGTGSQNQLQLLEQLPVRTLILALDPDDAGERGTMKIRKNVKYKIIKRVIGIPEGKDVNDLTNDEFDNLQRILI